MKILFFGTPEFAVPALESICKDGHFEITSVVTQPDKPGDRRKITPPPVKILAEKFGLKVHQPKKIDKNFIKTIKEESPDAILVVAYGGLIPKELLDFPKHGCINIHPSLLPRYRGASPIQETLLNGDDNTGISIMKLDEKLDHGPIYLIKRVAIDKYDNTEKLSIKLAHVAALILPFALKDIENGILSPIPQNDNKATFCSKITKEDGKIDWNKPAKEILNQIRALNPWPSTYTELVGKRLKIIEAEPSQKHPTNTKKPGIVEILDKEIIGFYAKDFLIIPKKLQLEGKPEMTAKEFLNGYKKFLS